MFTIAHAPKPVQDDSDDSDHHASTEHAADIRSWQVSHGPRGIDDDPAANPSPLTPSHHNLRILLGTFDAASNGWKDPTWAATAAGQDTRKTTQAPFLIRLGREVEVFAPSKGQADVRLSINGSDEISLLTERGSGCQPWCARRMDEATLGHPSPPPRAQAMV
jgi:hypothetical protein